MLLQAGIMDFPLYMCVDPVEAVRAAYQPGELHKEYLEELHKVDCSAC